MKPLLLISFLLLLTAGAQAQTGRPAPERSTPEVRTSSYPDSIPSTDSPYHTQTISAKVVRISERERALVVENKDGQKVKFVVNKKTRLRADKQTELADRKTISLADFKPGQ